MPNRSLLLRSTLATLILVGTGVAASTASAQQSSQSTRPVWPDEGPRTWTPRPTEPAITANDLRTRLYQFSDDSMEGRKIGSRGDYKGTTYIADVFRHAGLKPAGEKGTYFQDVPHGAYTLDGPAPRITIGKSSHAAGSA